MGLRLENTITGTCRWTVTRHSDKTQRETEKLSTYKSVIREVETAAVTAETNQE